MFKRLHIIIILFSIVSIIAGFAIHPFLKPTIFDLDKSFTVYRVGPPPVIADQQHFPLLGFLAFLVSLCRNYLIFKFIASLILLATYIFLFSTFKINIRNTIFLLTPSIIILFMNFWEGIPVALTILSLFSVISGHYVLSGVLAGISSSMSPIPIFIIPILYYLVDTNYRGKFLEILSTSFFLINFPLVMINFSSWAISYFNSIKYLAINSLLSEIGLNIILTSIIILTVIILTVLAFIAFNRERFNLGSYIAIILLIITVTATFNPILPLYISPLLMLIPKIYPLFLIFDILNLINSLNIPFLADYLIYIIKVFIVILIIRKLVSIEKLELQEVYSKIDMENIIQKPREAIGWLIERTEKNRSLIYLALFILTFIVLFYRLDYPNRIYFDEIYYVDDGARSILSLNGDQNRIHPPFGKELIALGILIFSDIPLAWRFFGALLSSLSPLLLYYISYKLFNSRKIALLSSLLLIIDPLFYTNSRIAMLDSYILFFSLLSISFFIAFYIGELKNICYLYLSALSFGLTIASKLPGVLPYLLCILTLLYKIIKVRKFKLLIHVFIAYFIITPTIYVLSYIPTLFLLGYGFRELIDTQFYMIKYSAHLPVTEPHPYSSQPWTWPIMTRPLLTLYDTFKIDGNIFVSCICEFGNPLTWILGLILVIDMLIDRSSYREFKYVFPLMWFLITWVAYFPLGISKLFGYGREMFIYYFLQSLPPLLIVFSYKTTVVDEYFDNHVISLISIASSFITFLISYPVISGIPINLNYVKGMRILKLF